MDSRERRNGREASIAAAATVQAGSVASAGGSTFPSITPLSVRPMLLPVAVSVAVAVAVRDKSVAVAVAVAVSCCCSGS